MAKQNVVEREAEFLAEVRKLEEKYNCKFIAEPYIDTDGIIKARPMAAPLGEKQDG